MILGCPECKARFAVDLVRFGVKPRRVRCGKCKHEWLAEPPPGFVAELAKLTPIPDVPPPPPPPQQLPVIISDKKPLRKILMIVLGVILLGGVSAGGYLYGPKLFGGDPAHEMLRAASLLDISDIKTEQTLLGNNAVLLVEGFVVNNTEEELPVPPLSVQALGANGAVLHSWPLQTIASTLVPGDRINFNARFSDVPQDLTEIAITFDVE